MAVNTKSEMQQYVLGLPTPDFPQFVFGNGFVSMAGEKAKELGMTRAMLVTDKGVMGAGLHTPVLESLHAAGIETVLFDGVLPDPPDTVVDAGGRMAAAEHVDGLVALGGGSSMDTAKGINVLMNNPGEEIRAYFVPNMPGPNYLPFLTIPTTAGTGAECTGSGVITDSKTKQKMAITAKPADFAIIDPQLYAGMPVKPSIYCAYDALAHTMDAIIAKFKEPFTRALAEKAVGLIASSLPKMIENPQDLDARGDLAFAATLGGVTLCGVGCHLSHAIGHSLGAVLHIPHGLGCGVAMPQLVELFAQILPEETRAFGKCMGFDIAPDAAGTELGTAMKRQMLGFMKATGLPSLKEQGFTLEQVLGTTPLMVTDITRVYWPVELTEDDFKQVMRDAYDQ
ncbi:MAG: iron-containing alcohol dehydrogenase [Oscillospiraceae bacterium]|nr:iron-containing alcohol dehydrogenase [Oscillospiraceae bacterium]